MVWNVAGSGESAYEPEAFGGRVVQLRYPGHLCPPLLTLVEACASIHAWLRADPANFVAVHCKSGRGRSAVVLACVAAFLSVHSEAVGPTSPIDWLSHLAHLRGLEEHSLTLPTHRRYLQYFAELLHSGPPAGADNGGCELRGVTLHSFPKLSTPPFVAITAGVRTLFASNVAAEAELPDATAEPHERVAYSYRAAARRLAKDGGSDGEDGAAPARPAWPVLHADAVLTLRESDRAGPILCRAGFHVDFAADAGVLRLKCNHLDGAFVRLPADAFVDLILAPRPPEPGTKGTGGLLGSAVESLRHASKKAADGAAGRAAPVAFGRAKAPEAVFAFGDDDDGDDSKPAPTMAPAAAAANDVARDMAHGGDAASGAQPPSLAAKKKALSPLEMLSRYSGQQAAETPEAEKAADAGRVNVQSAATATAVAAAAASAGPTAAVEPLVPAAEPKASTSSSQAAAVPPTDAKAPKEAAPPTAEATAVDEVQPAPTTKEPPGAAPYTNTTAADGSATHGSAAPPSILDAAPPAAGAADEEDDLDARIAEALGGELEAADLEAVAGSTDDADLDAEFEALV